MKLITDGKEDNREWKVVETYLDGNGNSCTIYEEVLNIDEPVVEKVDDYWC